MVYIVINDALEIKGYVKIGITSNLTDRLTTYNTSCKHSVIWHRSCQTEENMLLLDKLIKKKLKHCQVKANREHYIGNVDYLVGEIEKCLNFILE